MPRVRPRGLGEGGRDGRGAYTGRAGGVRTGPTAEVYVRSPRTSPTRLMLFSQLRTNRPPPDGSSESASSPTSSAPPASSPQRSPTSKNSAYQPATTASASAARPAPSTSPPSPTSAPSPGRASTSRSSASPRGPCRPRRGASRTSSWTILVLRLVGMRCRRITSTNRVISRR